MSTRSRRMIEEYLEGTSAAQLLDHIDEVNPQTIVRDIYHSLKSRGVDSRVDISRSEPDVINVIIERKTYLSDAIVELFEHTYPEYRIVVGTR